MATRGARGVLEAALKLPRKERAHLAQELLTSLDPSSKPDPKWEEAWTAELERRSRQIDERTTRLVDARLLFRELREQLTTEPAKKRATPRTTPRRARRAR